MSGKYINPVIVHNILPPTVRNVIIYDMALARTLATENLGSFLEVMIVE